MGHTGRPLFEYAAKIALASPFLVSGLTKLSDFGAAVAEVEGFGLHPAAPLAAAVIAVQLAGSILLLVRRFCWPGAVMLSGFTACATLLAHPFWAFSAGERIRQAQTFFEHLAIVGGLAIAAMPSRKRPT